MSRDLSVSTEMLTVNASRTLGPEIQAIVERLQETLRGSGNTWNDADLDALRALIKRRTRIVVERIRMNPSSHENAAAAVPVIPGHTGTGYRFDEKKPVDFNEEHIDKKIMETVIDLDNVQVIGPITKILTFELHLNLGLFTGRADLTSEEITAIVLHEIGHMFNVFMTLGDYVWLNYFLADGVQVLLGKKPNTYRLQILTRATLANSVSDPKEREALLKDPTEAGLRRALLIAFRKMPRHYLTSKDNANSARREEQLADNFASRMGYGRAMVTGNAKGDKVYGDRYLGDTKSVIIAETVKTLATFGALLLVPATLCLSWMVVTNTVWEDTSHPHYNRYDNPTERITKIRRDLIAQLKASQADPAFRQRLSEDIRVIDLVLNDYHQKRTLWETLGHVFSTERRRQWQLKNQEQVLENLMHNDLFVITQRFDQLNNTRA